MRLRNIITGLAAVVFNMPAVAWDGQDVDSGTDVEIDSGNLVREGEDIEIYDHDAGEYRNVTVESVTTSGFGAEVEVYDADSGEYRTFEMDQIVV